MEVNTSTYNTISNEDSALLDTPIMFDHAPNKMEQINTKSLWNDLRDIFNINDTLTNKISYYHILLLLFSLPFDLFYSHIILISFTVHTLINFKKESLKSIFNLRILILQSVFFVTFFGITYSPDKNAGFTELGRQLVILIVPLLFSITSFDLKRHKNNLLLGFSLCSTLTIAYLYLDAWRVIHYFKNSDNTLFSAAFTNHNFSDPIGMHATFLALQIGLAFVYLLSVLIQQTELSQKIFYGTCCTLLGMGLIQLSSKSVCITVLISICISVPLFILKNAKKRSRFITASLIVVALSGLALSQSQAFNDRFFNDLKDDVSKSTTDDITDPRLSRWKVAGALITKSPVIGYGTGAETNLLRNGYFDKKLYNSFLNKLNTHNEYLSLLLSTGMFGLLVYLATLYYGFKKALQTADVVFFTFMLLITIVSLSENVLDVDKGTIFYGLFFSFFVFTQSKVTPKAIII